jgi:hypothetical protein
MMVPTIRVPQIVTVSTSRRAGMMMGDIDSRRYERQDLIGV